MRSHIGVLAYLVPFSASAVVAVVLVEQLGYDVTLADVPVLVAIVLVTFVGFVTYGAGSPATRAREGGDD